MKHKELACMFCVAEDEEESRQPRAHSRWSRVISSGWCLGLVFFIFYWWV